MQEHETFTCEWCRQEHPISERIIYDGGDFCMKHVVAPYGILFIPVSDD